MLQLVGNPQEQKPLEGEKKHTVPKELAEASNATLLVNGIKRPLFFTVEQSTNAAELESLIEDAKASKAGTYIDRAKKPIEVARIFINDPENLKSKEIVLGIMPKKLPDGTIEFGIVEISQNSKTSSTATPLLLLTPEQINAIDIWDANNGGGHPFLNGLISSKAVQKLIADTGAMLIGQDSVVNMTQKIDPEIVIHRMCEVSHARMSDEFDPNITKYDTLEIVENLKKRGSLSQDEDVLLYSLQRLYADSATLLSQFYGFRYYRADGPPYLNNKGNFISYRNTNVRVTVTDTISRPPKTTEQLEEADNESQVEKRHFLIRTSDITAPGKDQLLHVELDGLKLSIFRTNSSTGNVEKVDLGEVDNNFDIRSFYTRLSLGAEAKSKAEASLRTHLLKIMPAVQAEELSYAKLEDVMEMKNKLLTNLQECRDWYREYYEDFPRILEKLDQSFATFSKAVSDFTQNFKRYTPEEALKRFCATVGLIEAQPKRFFAVLFTNPYPPGAEKFKSSPIPSEAFNKNGVVDYDTP